MKNLMPAAVNEKDAYTP